MKRAVVMTALLLLCLAWSGLGQQSDEDWHPFQEQKQKPAQSGGPLTNDSIVKLAKAGLGEDTIISMVNTQPGKYSLGADDIIALKKTGVSEKIIAAMLNRPAAAVTAAAEPAADSATEVGVYYKKDDAWVQVMPEMVNWKTGGVLKSVATGALFPFNLKGDVNGHLDGETSRIEARTPVEFLIRVPEGVEITEYQLIHLHEHHDGREFRTVTGGVLHSSGGARRDTLPFEYKKTASRTYLVSLSDLGAGEYGFLSPGAALSSHASAQLGKMYTFHVLE